MKKNILIFLPFFLFSCFGESDEIKQAKQELIGDNKNETQVVETTFNSQEVIQDEKEADYVPKTIGSEDDSVFLHLPIDENTYGSPIMTGESSFTYSQISNFEVIKNTGLIKNTCENIGDLLKEKYTWYYWNTCRPIYTDSFWVNVLTLTGDKYKYERHYIDNKYNFYGILLFEEGTGISQNDLQSKNDELKQKSFEMAEKTDKLFKDLLK